MNISRKNGITIQAVSSRMSPWIGTPDFIRALALVLEEEIDHRGVTATAKNGRPRS